MSDEKQWWDIHAVQARAEAREPGSFLLSNIRNVTYRGDEFSNYTTEWLSSEYNTKDLTRVWFIENNYAKMQSHIMLTFEFSGNRFLAASVEVRKENAQDFEVWHVLHKTFHVFYILAMEYDILYLRTNVRKSPVYLYDLALSKETREKLFTQICTSVHRTYDNNDIYKVFRSDCVSTLLANFRAAGITVKKYWWDWSPTRVLYRSGLIQGNYKTLAEVFKETLVTPEKTAGESQNNHYSLFLRGRA